jgi:hypothetical protein
MRTLMSLQCGLGHFMSATMFLFELPLDQLLHLAPLPLDLLRLLEFIFFIDFISLDFCGDHLWGLDCNSSSSRCCGFC